MQRRRGRGPGDSSVVAPGEKAGGVPVLAFPEPRCSPGWKVVAGMRSGGTEPDSRAGSLRLRAAFGGDFPEEVRRRKGEKEGGRGGGNTPWLAVCSPGTVHRISLSPYHITLISYRGGGHGGPRGRTTAICTGHTR